MAKMQICYDWAKKLKKAQKAQKSSKKLKKLKKAQICYYRAIIELRAQICYYWAEIECVWLYSKKKTATYTTVAQLTTQATNRKPQNNNNERQNPHQYQFQE